MSTGRIKNCFARLSQEGRTGLIGFFMAGDPDPKTSRELIHGAIERGVDIIELGIPFSDPMADGKTIQAAGQRALQGGQTVKKTLKLAARIRKKHPHTPLLLMGYYNPIYHYGVERFLTDMTKADLDGLIIVDTPPEEDQEICLPAKKAGIDFIRMATPTSNPDRLKKITNNADGFLYYISVAGITGTQYAHSDDTSKAMAHLRNFTNLPIAAGFGIRHRDQIKQLCGKADAIVIGSAIIDELAYSLDKQGHAQPHTLRYTLDFIEKLAEAVRNGAK